MIACTLRSFQGKGESVNKTEKDAHFKSQLSQAMVWGDNGVAAKGGALSHQESGRSPRQFILSSG